MLDILICFDGSVSKTEKKAVGQAARDIYPMFGCDFIFLDSSNWPEQKYGSAERIIQFSPQNERKQTDVATVLTMMSEVKAKWHNPAVMVLFTGEDLAIGDRWVFGGARIKARVSVQSMVRYRSLPEHIMADLVARTLRHELGHIFGCVTTPGRSNTEENLGTHCTNPGCSMRQTSTLNELMRAAMLEDPHDFFCEQCKSELRKFRARV